MLFFLWGETGKRTGFEPFLQRVEGSRGILVLGIL